MSFKQTDFCYECKEQPDNLLSLQCGHDLCLNCSSLQYYKFSYKKKNFLCQICGKSTPLDHSSIYELEKLIISHPPEEKIQSIGRDEERRRTQQDRILQEQGKQVENYNNISKGVSQQSQKLQTNEDYQRFGWKSNYQRQQQQQGDHNQKFISQENEEDKEYNKYENSRYQQISFLDDSQRICKEHDDEEVNYFCFDCKNNCICPECIIHGVHKDHNVKTIKKSYPIVKQILEDYKLDLENTISAISNKKDSVYQQKSEIQTIQKNLKLEITTVLKQKVDETCQQLIQQTEEIAKKSLRDLDETIKQIDKNILNFRKNEEQISEQLRTKEEYRLINYYGLNSKSIDDKEQFQIAKQIFSNHIHKKNQFLNIKSLIEDQIFELQNIEKKFQGQLQSHNYSSFTEEQEIVTKETKKLNTTQDQNKENSNNYEDFKKFDKMDNKLEVIERKNGKFENKYERIDTRNDLIDKKYLNPVSFTSNLQSQEGFGISRQLDQDFERMKENLKKSSKYRASSLKKSDYTTDYKDQDIFLNNFNIKNNKI